MEMRGPTRSPGSLGLIGASDDRLSTLAVLQALFDHRLDRAAEIGYEPTEHGALVDWGRLLTSWLSETEEAAVHIAWGASVAERRGGLPEEVHGAVRRLLEAITR